MVKEKTGYIIWFENLSKEDTPIVGGKCANLGELMAKAKVPVPPGFAITAYAYEYFLEKTGIKEKIFEILRNTNTSNLRELEEASKKIRELIESAPMPEDLKEQIINAYKELCRRTNTDNVLVAVRSSATAEDLPGASFAGEQETYLNVSGEKELIEKVKKCWSSLFTPRAITYRESKGFAHENVLISVAVQQMVDAMAAGVMFTIHPATGEKDKIMIEANWGLGESVVSGIVTPDTYIVDKRTFKILEKNISEKKIETVRDPKTGETAHREVPPERRNAQVLTDEQIVELAKYGVKIEQHYGSPQDIEWAIDKSGRIFILQARPETVWSLKEKEEKEGAVKMEAETEAEREVLVKGLAASPGIGIGEALVFMSAKEAVEHMKEGAVLVTKMTSPDWVPAMKKATAIVTDEGGYTCHAAIVSRELGIPCVVGTGNATKVLKDVGVVTVDGSRGVVYKGALKEMAVREKEREVVAPAIGMVQPITATKIYVNIAFPEIAEKVARETQADGVGLLRAEHMMVSIGKHPRKLIEEGGEQLMVDAFAEGIRKVAEAFYPKPVVYRFLDFKPDEFLELEGGKKYELEAGHVGPNPMIGYRGAYRYIREPDIFRLELRAIKKVRDEYGLKNVWVMVPFVRTVEELREIKRIMKEEGLDPDEDPDFKLWIMVEVPSTVFLIDKFIEEGIDGVSFGTNDLTQLILGIDRNDASVQEIYDERNLAVLRALAYVIKVCKRYGVTTSICGQAPSQYMDYLEFLVRMGVTSISVNPDAVQEARRLVAMIEQRILTEKVTGKYRVKVGKYHLDEVEFWKLMDDEEEE
ncbi:MAG: phosphoenolpyruvate synthase [Candidatus Baldrarchaeia archaeon]